MPQCQPSPRQLRVLADLRLSGAGESVRINASDADSCCDMGWVVLHNRRYVLTASGRAVSVL
jgi:hypothetical protein